MAGGLFNRVTTWISLQVLGYQAQNAEFDNIIQHLIPNYLDDYSASLSQMQETLSPGGAATEVQATTLAEELKQLRYMLKLLSGGTYWYSAPPATLTDLNNFLGSLPGHRIVSGRIDANSQPMFVVPANASAGFTLKATTTNLVAQMAGTQRTFTADIAVAGISTAPGSNNTCLVDDASLGGAASTKIQGEQGTVITIDTIGSEISALNGKMAAFKIVGGGTEYFIARVDTTNNRLTNVRRGFFFDSSDATIARTTISNNDTITLMKLTWVFGTYDGSSFGADVTYNEPVVAPSQPSSPAIGDYWFDLTNATWKKYSGVSFATVTAIPVGMCIQTSTVTIAARSFDFFKGFTGRATTQLQYVDASTVRARYSRAQVDVYGTNINFDVYTPTWSTATDLDTGTTDAASVQYYLYVTPAGARKISNVAPYDRTMDLLGWYHPSKPWRCVGEIANDSSSDFDSATLSNVIAPNRVQTSSGSSTFNTTSTTYVDVTSVTKTITTKGGTLFIGLVSDYSGGTGHLQIGATSANNRPEAIFQILRDATQIYEQLITYSVSNTGGAPTTNMSQINVPGGVIWMLDSPPAGTYTYKLQVKLENANQQVYVTNQKLLVFEIPRA